MKAASEYPGLLTAGTRLLGHYSWLVAMRLVSVRVIAGSCRVTPTVLALEVDGVASGKTVTLAPSPDGETRLTWPLNLVVTAGQEVRWAVVSAPASGGDQASRIMVELDAVPEDLAGSAQSAVRLFVKWVSGQERLDLYDYAGGVFMESAAGITAGRATVVNGPDFEATIEGSPAMRVNASGVCMVNQLKATAASGLAGEPRLEFWMEDGSGQLSRMARLTGDGTLYVTDLVEGAPTAGSGVFELKGGSVLKATLGAGGLVAADFTEGIV